MLILVIYDISDTETRTRLADYLRAKGFVRIQRSTFAGRPPPHVLRDVERALTRFIRDPGDVIHLVPVPENYIPQIRVYGHPFADIAQKTTLVFVN